jgi:DNA-directed RNA polymerase alpha subunit
MDLYAQIEAFQKNMNQIVALMEEAKAHAGEIPDVTVGQAANKVKLIFDICGDGMKNLKEAIAQAEDILKILPP